MYMTQLRIIQPKMSLSFSDKVDFLCSIQTQWTMAQKLLIHRRLDKNFQFQDDWTNISSPAYSQINPVWTRCAHHDVCPLTAELRSI